MALIRKLGAIGIVTAAVAGFVACAQQVMTEKEPGATGAGEPAAEPSPASIPDHSRIVDTHQARTFSAQIKADRAAQDAARKLKPQTTNPANWAIGTGSSVLGAPAVYGPSFTSEGSTDQMFFGVTGSGAGKGVSSTSYTNCTSSLCGATATTNFFAFTNIYAATPSLSWAVQLSASHGTSADVALNGSGTEVYILDDGGTLHCLQAANGGTCTGGWVNPTIAITGVAITPWVDSSLNAVYINDGTKHLYKFNATTGAQVWKYTYTANAASRSEPLEADNIVYIGDGAGDLYRVIDNGTSLDSGTIPTSDTPVALNATNCATQASIDGSVSIDSTSKLVFIPNGQCLFSLNHIPSGSSGTFAIQHTAVTYSLPNTTLKSWPALDGTYVYWVIPQVPTTSTPISAVWKAPYNLSSLSGADLVNATSTTGGATATSSPLLYNGSIYVGDTSGYVERFGCASSNFSTTTFSGYTAQAGTQVNSATIIDNQNGNIEYGYSGGVAQFPMDMGTAAAPKWNCPSGQVMCDNQQCGAGSSKTACVPTAECASASSTCITVASVPGATIQCAEGAEDVNTPANSTITSPICPSGNVIQGILAGSYGSNNGADFETCTGTPRVFGDAGLGFNMSGTCFESSSLTTTDSYCPIDVSRECSASFLADNAVFGNPCPDVNKFFQGWFVCAPQVSDASAGPLSTYVFCSRQNMVAWQSDGGVDTGETSNDPCNTGTGKCEGSCKTGWGDCNSNLQYDGCETYTGGTDSSNCGSCGNVCSVPTNGSSVACSGGVCTPTCASGYVVCGGGTACCAECTSAYTQTGYNVTGCPADTASGTSCGATCASGYSGTVAGSVSCVAPAYSGSFTGCAAECLTAYSQTGYVLSNCGVDTPSGTTCAASCDTANGFAGTPTGTVSCSSGSYTGTFSGCACPGGTTLCNGVCLSTSDLQSDSNNCGSCGNVCATVTGGNVACSGGFCEGSVVYTTSSTFTVPTGITHVSIVAVGGGGAGSSTTTSDLSGGGGGGALCYANSITVVAGSSIAVTVGTGATAGNGAGAAGGLSKFVLPASATPASVTVTASGGSAGAAATNASPEAGGAGGTCSLGAGGFASSGTGTGGAGGTATTSDHHRFRGGGGGAGGYGGAGGAGATAANTGTCSTVGGTGSNGGGGGGGAGSSSDDQNDNCYGGSGGGVGLYGSGTSGTGGTTYCDTGAGTTNGNGTGGPGLGGSTDGHGGGTNAGGSEGTGTHVGVGGSWGGGGGTDNGGPGAVRVVWWQTGLSARNFPSTGVGSP